MKSLGLAVGKNCNAYTEVADEKRVIFEEKRMICNCCEARNAKRNEKKKKKKLDELNHQTEGSAHAS